MTAERPLLHAPPDPLIGSLFGPDVLTDSSPLTAEADDLLPEERPLIARAVPSRRREFATGRVRARTLLARLGIPDFPLLRDRDRIPLWPDGVVGSISHTEGLCAVAVAVRDEVLALGVDAEPDGAIETELWARICTEAELAWLERQPAPRRGRLARAFFSAKECTYKCLYPLARLPLGFHDVEVELDLEGGRFRSTVVSPGEDCAVGRTRLLGSIALREGWILTGATLRSGDARTLTDGPTGRLRRDRSEPREKDVSWSRKDHKEQTDDPATLQAR